MAPPNRTSLHRKKSPRYEYQENEFEADHNEALARQAEEEIEYFRRIHRGRHFATAVCAGVVALFCLVHAGRSGYLFGGDGPGKRMDRVGISEEAQKWAISLSDRKLWSDDVWVYRPSDFPPKTLNDYVPYLNSTFAHGSIMHLAVNSWGFYVLGISLIPALGVASTIALFTVSGTAAALIDAGVEKAYAEGLWRRTFALLKNGQDPDPSRTLMASYQGASGGLAAMAMMVALSRPGVRFGIPFLRIGIPAIFMVGGLVGYDMISFYNNSQDGIGHGGHLAGYFCGAVAWFGVFRWMRAGRMARQLGWFL